MSFSFISVAVAAATLFTTARSQWIQCGTEYGFPTLRNCHAALDAMAAVPNPGSHFLIGPRHASITPDVHLPFTIQVGGCSFFSCAWPSRHPPLFGRRMLESLAVTDVVAADCQIMFGGTSVEIATWAELITMANFAVSRTANVQGCVETHGTGGKAKCKPQSFHHKPIQKASRIPSLFSLFPSHPPLATLRHNPADCTAQSPQAIPTTQSSRAPLHQSSRYL